MYVVPTRLSARITNGTTRVFVSQDGQDEVEVTDVDRNTYKVLPVKLRPGQRYRAAVGVTVKLRVDPMGEGLVTELERLIAPEMTAETA